MSDIAIRAENLSKSYNISHSGSGGGYKTLQEDLLRLLKHPFGNKDDTSRRETFWALKDVSFEVKHGEVLGIIGRNGAGKSTLLKILSRITKPTSGRADIYGRVGSLLEVGTGFHAELTGRENIFLNGAVLGMTRRDIQKHFDEIVAFAEIEQFLDTPVKRYSSGMYMRLAFAVAAHLEPEVLIIDEVLAVGDAEFQKKCLGKMSDVAKGGRTVLFVSHSMPAVNRLCTRTILFDCGQILAEGESPAVTSLYLKSNLNSVAAREWMDTDNAPGNDVVRLTGVYVRKADGRVAERFAIGESITIEIKYKVLNSEYPLVPVIRVTNQDGVVLFTELDQEQQWHHQRRLPGIYSTQITIPENLFAESFMTVLVTLNTFSPRIAHVNAPDVVGFYVLEDESKSVTRSVFGGTLVGVIRPHLNWRTKNAPPSPS